jgi:thiosulfate dehydrogenase
MALIQELLVGLTLDGGQINGDPVAGGLLFDNWPVVTGVLPEGEHGLWGIQSTNSATGAATWRCSECHGWDYKGAGGEYASGEHYTGFPGLVEFSRVLTQTQVLEFLHGGVDARHDFTNWLTDEQMLDLSAFVKTEIINLATYVDYETLKPRGGFDAERGKLLYGRTCTACHGTGGSNVDLGDPGEPLTLSAYAKVNPFETIHKTRFGQPGVPGMPATEERGWSTVDVIAVLGYLQSLEPD